MAAKYGANALFGGIFLLLFPPPFFAMSELGEVLEADAIIQALGVFFPVLFAKASFRCELVR